MPISESIANIPLYKLNITTRVYNQLCAAGIDTVGKFTSAFNSKTTEMAVLTPKTLKSINQHIKVLSETAEQGIPNWIEYAKVLEIPIIPSDYADGSTPIIALNQVPSIIERALDDERRWYIIERRFEFNGSSKLTLQDLGETFGGLSRQRIDQLWDESIRKIKAVFIQNSFLSESYRVHPEILKIINDIVALLIDRASNGILQNELFEQIQKSFALEIKNTKPVIFLLLELCDFDCIDFGNSDLQPIWGKFDKKTRKVYETAIPKIDKLLTIETVHPQKDFDVLRLINKSMSKNAKLMPSDIKLAIELCSSVEKRKDGMYWGKFEFLKGRANQVERLLLEKSKTVSIDVLVREINHRLVLLGARKANSRNVLNQVSGDDRFIKIGKSGQWGLKTWEHIDTGNIVELMEEFFIQKNKPATVDEIYEYVSGKRPVERSSIIMYLSTKSVFAKHDRTQWKLAKWNEPDGDMWGLDQVASFVEGIFKKNRTKVLEYKVVKQALMDAAGLSAKQAQGMLNINPVIVTHWDEHRKIYATLQENYQEKLAKVKSYGLRKTNATLGEKIGDRIKEIVSSSPNGQILLSELVKKLRKEFTFNNRPEPYGYVQRQDAVEVISLPNQRQKMCRIKETPRFLQVEKISNLQLQEKVKRAVGFLNLENVDVGLFLLSKEFESVLLTYLLQAEKRGKIVNPTPGKWKSLDEMINFISKEGLVTDKATLHYLRQKRNDRAHGTMPSLDERQLMMNNLQIVTSLYIDYIKFFDDLTNAL